MRENIAHLPDEQLVRLSEELFTAEIQSLQKETLMNSHPELREGMREGQERLREVHPFLMEQGFFLTERQSDHTLYYQKKEAKAASAGDPECLRLYTAGIGLILNIIKRFGQKHMDDTVALFSKKFELVVKDVNNLSISCQIQALPIPQPPDTKSTATAVRSAVQIPNSSPQQDEMAPDYPRWGNSVFLGG